MSLTFELNLKIVMIKQRAMYFKGHLLQKSLFGHTYMHAETTHTRTHTHTHTHTHTKSVALHGPLKWSDH